MHFVVFVGIFYTLSEFYMYNMNVTAPFNLC